MTQTRAADDFATIRARMEELRRESAKAAASENSQPLRADSVLADRERRLKERREGHPPPWAPTIFVSGSGNRASRDSNRALSEVAEDQ